MNSHYKYRVCLFFDNESPKVMLWYKLLKNKKLTKNCAPQNRKTLLKLNRAIQNINIKNDIDKEIRIHTHDFIDIYKCGSSSRLIHKTNNIFRELADGIVSIRFYFFFVSLWNFSISICEGVIYLLLLVALTRTVIQTHTIGVGKCMRHLCLIFIVVVDIDCLAIQWHTVIYSNIHRHLISFLFHFLSSFLWIYKK